MICRHCQYHFTSGEEMIPVWTYSETFQYTGDVPILPVGFIHLYHLTNDWKD